MRQFSFSILLCLLCCFSAAAQDKLIFVVGNDVCAPITVRCQGSTYRVNSYLEVERTSSSVNVSATDCDGNKLKYEFSSSSGTQNGRRYSISTYTFHTIKSYGSGSSSYGGSSSGSYGSSNSNSNSNSSWSDTGARIGQGLATLTSTSAMYQDGNAYPGLHLQAGMSKGFGEFARLRLAAGGFQLYGGVGKDWFFNGENKDKLLWHVGFGGYVGFGGDYTDPNQDIAFGLTFAENAAWQNYSLTFDLGYTYWFGSWRRVGAFAGAGLGFGDIKDVGKDGHHCRFAWNLEVGLTLRLAHF